MKKIIRRILIKLLSPFIKKLGFVSATKNNNLGKNTLLLNIIELFKTAQFEPQIIIDIGANHGTWSRELKSAYPKAQFVLVEPQEWLKPSFEDLLTDSSIFLPVGAGKENGTFKFTINSDRDDSSTFALSSNDASTRGYKQIDVPIYTLNHIVKTYLNHTPELVKIDAEGIDLEVLDGASDLLGETECFLVEASINAPLEETTIEKTITYMDQKGYRVFEFTDLNRPFKSKALWLVEIAFIKKGGILDNINWMEI
jgi:FkbM family methyltransferase